jgi:class 3 adenylate cyclase/tetratricopeptide (TPR) repeat protein
MKTTSSTAERRNLTIVFADLVGSSVLAARLDPEDLRIILRSVQASFRNAITRYGGHIARYLGDGVLAYFGFPIAHEDAAERAVNAALEMRVSISALSFPYLAEPLQVHIGIATGLVVVGESIGEGPSVELELVGEPLNVAAWLQQNAKPDEILVAPQTRALLHELFEIADLGERRIKGYERPVRIWSVLRHGPLQSRFDAHRSLHLTPFVGREDELALLIEQYEKTRKGNGRLVCICGEAGIGKSRLIAMLFERLRGETVRRSLFQCSSYHTLSPFYPIIRHIELATGIKVDDSASVRLQKLEDFVDKEVVERRTEIIFLIAALLSIPVGERYPPLELTPQQQRRRTLLALVELLRPLAGVPMLLIFEDIHWIDPTSWELLQLLGDETEHSSILLILSFRPEVQPTLSSRPPDCSIIVNPLKAADAALMVQELSADRPLAPTLVQKIVDKSDGVPLFVEEVTETLLQAMMSTVDPGVPARIPETLHDSLMARVDRIPEMKTVAQVSAAIGREFRLDLLEAVTPLSVEETRAGIERLIESGLVSRHTAGAAESFAFKHALVQEAAYASMLRSERQTLHARIAEVIAGGFPNLVEGAPELLAHHYTQAREFKLAIMLWLRAGRQASRASAFVEAIAHFQTGLGLIADLPETDERNRFELLLQQSSAGALIAAKGFGAAETTQAFEKSFELCKRLDDSAQLFFVLNGLITVHYMRGDFEHAHSLAQDLLARASRQGDTTAVLMGHRILGMSLFAMGELPQARQHLQNALEIYDPHRHAPSALPFPLPQDIRATAEVYLGLTLSLLGDVESGLRHSREALAHAEQLRDPHSICYVLTFLAGAHLVSSLPNEAITIAERAIELSEEYGFPLWVAGALLMRGWARIDLRKVDLGLDDICDSISKLKATGTRVWMEFAHFLQARGLMLRGELGGASELVERILADIGNTGGRWYEAEVLRLKGDLLLATHPTESDAEAFYRAAVAVAMRQGTRLLELRARASLEAPHHPNHQPR